MQAASHNVLPGVVDRGTQGLLQGSRYQCTVSVTRLRTPRARCGDPAGRAVVRRTVSSQARRKGGAATENASAGHIQPEGATRFVPTLRGAARNGTGARDRLSFGLECSLCPSLGIGLRESIRSGVDWGRGA